MQHAIVGIDPSILSLGVAIEIDGRPDSASVIKQGTSSDVSYHTRCIKMADMLAKHILCNTFDDTVDVVTEVPENWMSDRGEDSKNNEAVQKLYLQVGCILSRLAVQEEIRSIWVATPSRWKGSAPKEVMIRRARNHATAYDRILDLNAPHDVCESVLIARRAVESLKNFDPSHAATPVKTTSHKVGDYVLVPFTLVHCRTYTPTAFSVEDYLV